MSSTDPWGEFGVKQLPDLTLATGWRLGPLPCVKKHQVARLKTVNFKLENPMT